MKSFLSVGLSALLYLGFINSVFAEALDAAPSGNEWNGWNDPLKMDRDFEVNFHKLPLTGNLEGEGLGWPGYYWANNKGGIAHRWRSSNPNDFEYRSPKLNEILSSDRKALDELSPAEKYDLFMGRYDYPTVSQVWGQTREGHKDWYGICHGVSPSSLNHPEPMAKTVVNKDGIEIPFHSSDVKALLAYYYAKISDSKMVQVGKRCFVASWIPILRNTDGCSDVNPASFHIILSNKLGIDKTGFIADMERYSPVWNHAAVKYSSKVARTAGPSRSSSRGSVKRVKIESEVSYSASVDPSDAPIIGTPAAEYEERKYSYWLDLDSKGEIIGGEWISSDRPDFLWVKEKDEFSGYWSGLQEVYQADL